jgi:hypothetical protein
VSGHLGLSLKHLLTDPSKGQWKIKLKEWKFEKNVPSKEMGFMAAKARKREFEEGKSTVFYRHGVLVDGSKVEQFKKQKLNVNEAQGQEMPGKQTLHVRIAQAYVRSNTPEYILPHAT